MKNFKILENRPELSAEQLTAGMDFNKIKTNAALAKAVVLKSLIIKAVVAVAIAGSGLFVYKTLSNPNKNNSTVVAIDSTKQQPVVMIDSVIVDEKSNTDTVPVVKNIARINSTAHHVNGVIIMDSAKAIANTTKIEQPVIVNATIPTLENKVKVDSVIPLQERTASKITNQKRSKVTKVKSCKIWKTNSLCNFPKAAKFATMLDCDEVDFDPIDCNATELKGNYTGVWLTITSTEKSTFQIESELKNITLVNANNKTQNPLLIYISGDTKYWGTNFKAKKLTAHYAKQMDFFLIFKNASVGDKVIITDLIEALIEQ